MDANHIDDTAAGALQTETERVAAQLLLRLDALAIDAPARAREAERYAARLRFALDHLADLRRSPAPAGTPPTGGAFVPARVEVALSILESHLMTAARFLGVARRGSKKEAALENVADVTAAMDERGTRAA
jgi:hypothetical protein